MIRRRHLFVGAAIVLILVATSSTAGLSSMSADRGISGEVVDDSSAYLGFEQTTADTSDGITTVTITITNQYAHGTTLETVEISLAGQTVDVGPLATGESNETTVSGVPCGDPITVEVTGESVSATVERTVDCQ